MPSEEFIECIADDTSSVVKSEHSHFLKVTTITGGGTTYSGTYRALPILFMRLCVRQKQAETQPREYWGTVADVPTIHRLGFY